METFRLILVSLLSIISIFLAWRCIVLTKALARYHALFLGLIHEELTRESVKIIAAAIYGLTVDEVDRRLKNEH